MKKSLKVVIPLVITFALILPIGIAVNATKAYEDKIFYGVKIKGVDVGGLTVQQAKELIEKKYNIDVKNKKINLNYKDYNYTINYKTLDAHYNIDLATNVAYSFSHHGNIIVQSIRMLKLKKSPYDVPLNFVANTVVISKDVEKISSDIYKAPVDATIRHIGSFIITPEKSGIKVNEKKLTSLIKAAVNPIRKEENINIPVSVVKAKINTDMLSKINTKLASFSTAFRITDSNRSGNIKIAADSVNGTLVLPGELFSMNKAVGPRVASKGYKEAHVIINGTLVPGMAGGICQVTTTIYNAALLANFPIVERRPHGLKVGYVSAGRDATISGDAIDLKFKNTNKTPIYIKTYVSGSNVVATIYGANENPGQSVVISSEILKRISPKTEYIHDSSLPAGISVVDNKPIPGIKSITYRKVYQNGELVKSEILSRDYYKPSNAVIRVGIER